MRVRKDHPFAVGFLIDLSGALVLATRNILCQRLQRMLCWIEPVAKRIGQLTLHDALISTYQQSSRVRDIRQFNPRSVTM